MIKLNLIPYNKREEASSRRSHRLMALCFVVLIFLFVIALILTVADVFLVRRINNLVTLKTRFSDVRERAQKLNEKTFVLSQLQEKFVSHNEMLIDFAETVPESGIKIEELLVDIINGNLKIKGIALTRDDFMKFKANMEKSTRFSRVQSPIENILTKEQISFQIVAQINFSKL